MARSFVVEVTGNSQKPWIHHRVKSIPVADATGDPELSYLRSAR
jgi:hypothetical protein